MVNKGLRDESNVSFQLLIDGVTVNSTIENLLVRGSAVSLTYAFTPTEERKYNVTAYVKPVSNEEYTQNNMVSVNIVVRAQIKVPHDYATIQEAINNAVSGETIVVARGVYHEHLGIDKPLTLLGEDPNTTIIDGGYEKMFVVIIKSDQVVLNGFTLRNGGGAILLEYSNKSTITHNIIENTTDGLSLFRSHDNAITNNTMRHNGKGLFLGYSNNCIIYHNNFINNTDQVKILCSENIWDDGAEGNYWSDYTGQDFDNNGIGDTPYVIDQDNRDDYPLMRQNPIS
jgi:parallel beta-helix repeat protein